MKKAKKQVSPTKAKAKKPVSPTEAKAKQLQQQIVANCRGNQKPIYEFCINNYFLDLGFNSLKEWAVKNQDALGRSYDSINNDFITATITVNMCGEENIGKFSSYAFLQMKKLSAEQRKELFEHAQEHFNEKVLNDKHLTHENIKKFMEEMKLRPKDDDSDNETKQKGDISIHDKKVLKFQQALEKADSKIFAKRIAIAVNETTKPLSQLSICKVILKTHNNPEVITLINNMIAELKK
ncbi:hypothetical protein [Shewanella atlantica]|uniref:Uncharacterized protein n=1 Tax=Shewanella atlantica TaxID=271099 RepID=A0A3S0JYD4_9GAMM|nr:hypothetical protein [Shewanella atlantica]RTR31661.1 hypothetical protein EKG39_13175 [Shewanella atlantica]